MKKKIIISINTAWNILNFRSGLIQAIIEEGYDVIALAPEDKYTESLIEIGCQFVPIKIDNKGTNPLKDIMLYISYLHCLNKIKPVAFLGYTIKPNIYGSLAAHALNIPVINNISGLGTAFIDSSLLQRVVEILYRVAFVRSSCVFFQNNDDKALFEERKIVNKNQTKLLPGSGVNLKLFIPTKMIHLEKKKPFRFLFIGRILRDKGIIEYVESARILKSEGHVVSCAILGFLDVENRTSINRETMDNWIDNDFIEYLGSTDDVKPYINKADCIVLPSYREGTPKTLLEAAAMGKPLIATDVPGCRETVEHGKTGYLCKVRDAIDLSSQMKNMMLLEHEELVNMGNAGRLKMELEFDEHIVINSYLKELQKISS